MGHFKVDLFKKIKIICNRLYSNLKLAEMCGHFVISNNTLMCQNVPNCAKQHFGEMDRGLCSKAEYICLSKDHSLYKCSQHFHATI